MLAALVVVMAVPATASAVLRNEYGMKYAGQDICTSCHEPLTYGGTSHSDFAVTGAIPAADHMWPAGRLGVGDILEKSQIAFTLGAGTGLVEYLVNNEVAPAAVTYTAIQGDSRYQTAVNASMEAFASANTVVIATGVSFPDAMGGAALAGAVDGPVLLTPAAAIPQTVMNEITRLGATKIYVLGGTGAVSDVAFAQLDAAFADVERIAGGSRYQTAAAIADEVISLLGPGYGGGAFMATGANFPDALGASPIMYAKGMPLVLVDPAGNYTLPAATTDVVILGGPGAVSSAVETSLGTKFEIRLSGISRYDTAAAVAQYGVGLGMSWDGVGIATGQNFPDALCAGPLLGSNNAVMLLTASTSLSPGAQTKLVANTSTIGNLTFVGGTGAVSTNVRNQVAAILTGVPSADTNPFVVPSLEWDPAFPDTWEVGEAGIELETYSCGNCHHLGWVAKGSVPTTGNFVTGATAPASNHWVTDPVGPTTSPEKYVAGSSIQCEVCHGTGTPTGVTGNHFGVFTSNVKILRGTELLDSQVCGQCHGRYEGGNTRGYTPDQNLLTFVDPYDYADIPAADGSNWNGGINAATGKAWSFYPNGANRGLKHSYYQEWIMSGHSYRGQYIGDESNPRSTPFQQDHRGHFNAKTSSLNCAKCHTGEGYAVRKNLKIMEDFTPTNANTGFMGQECAVCHVPHGATTENGMDVRKPDTTPTLLGIQMTSICEDCHNYQLEMEGKVFPATPSNPATISLSARAGDFFSHPTREIYNGKAMYDVEDAGQFMPGVKCEECHMPATRSDFPDKTGLERYANRSWKRYSHRMFIMEPGDAEAWNLAPWGDSCSPCHAGQTQASLQGYIEEWQAVTAAAAAETKAAYEAAWLIRDTTAGSGDLRLLARARVNYKNYTGEGSLGAHNPEYIKDGLDVATKMAKSVGGTFGFVTGGTAYAGLDYITGRVLNGDGSGAAGATIVVLVDAVPTTVTADANGNFTVLYATGSAIGSITWERCGDPLADIVLVP